MFSQEVFDQNVQSASDRAELARSQIERPNPFQLVEVDLSNGFTADKPFALPSYPYRSLWVYDSTDTSAKARLALHSRERPHIDQTLQLKFNLRLKLPYMVGQSYITADAQPGAKMYIVLVAEGEISPGLDYVVSSGGVAIVEGDSAAPAPAVSVGTTATQLASADPDRKVLEISHFGDTPIYLADRNTVKTAAAGVGQLIGIPLWPGETYLWRPTSDVYAVSDNPSQLVGLVTKI